jgi:hypothetical protein
MYFECVHRAAEGYAEKYGRVAVRIGSHVITVEALKPAGAI